MSELTLAIPDDAWNDEEEGLLHTTIFVNGTPMHLEAWECRDADGDIQAPPIKSCITMDHFDALAQAVDPDGHWETTRIRGRDYVLVASPHC